MPVHDAMYTHSMADRFKKHVDSDRYPEMYHALEDVQDTALESSKVGTKAVLDFFTVLEEAMDSDDKTLATEASKIFYSSYNAEIA